MLICENCGAVFEEPIKGFEEEKDSCPNCGDWGIREAKKCIVCGEPCLDDLCENCLGMFKEAVEGFIDMYSKELGLPKDRIIDLIEDNLVYGGE